MTRRGRGIALTITFVALGACLIAFVFLPVPYVRLSPGPVYNALGDVNGNPLSRCRVRSRTTRRAPWV